MIHQFSKNNNISITRAIFKKLSYCRNLHQWISLSKIPGASGGNIHINIYPFNQLKILHKFTFTIVVTDDMRISFGPHSYIFHLRCSDGRVKNNFLFESKPGAFGETKIELYDELCESGIYQLNIAMVKSKGQGLYEIMVFIIIYFLEIIIIIIIYLIIIKNISIQN